MEYQNAAAIVTGASSGIGRQITVDLARRGCRTLVVARRESELRETRRRAEAEGSACEILVADVAAPETARRAVSLARDRFGRLDLLVNNAGMSQRKHLLAITPEEAERTVRVNLLGPVFFVLEALPLMVERGFGVVVNVGSVAGRIGNPREAIYSASKFGLAGLSEVMHYDLHRRGIRTILVNPGPIATEIWEKLESPAAYRGRFYSAADVSRAIFACIERGAVERTVPRHLGVVSVLKSLFPRLLRAAIDRFDPDDPSRDPRPKPPP